MNKYIVAFETSCDETSCAIFNTYNQQVVSCVVKTQMDHIKYGGVIPDQASQEHLKYINMVFQESLDSAQLKIEDINLIACTSGPGLPGALLVGLNFAKSIAWKYNIPFVGINHLEGHIYSGGIGQELNFPFLCLSVSGGHTAIYKVDSFSSYFLLSNTQDDAAGELFDKISNVIGLGYPGGAILEKYAKQIEFQDFIKYPRLKKNSGYLSFSGLKTAVLYDLVKRNLYNLSEKKLYKELSEIEKQQIGSSLLNAVSDSLISRLDFFYKQYPEIKEICFVGGVSCNDFLKNNIKKYCQKNNLSFKYPIKKMYSTDNAAMIAYIAQYRRPHNLEMDINL